MPSERKTRREFCNTTKVGEDTRVTDQEDDGASSAMHLVTAFEAEREARQELEDRYARLLAVLTPEQRMAVGISAAALTSDSAMAVDGVTANANTAKASGGIAGRSTTSSKGDNDGRSAATSSLRDIWEEMMTD